MSTSEASLFHIDPSPTPLGENRILSETTLSNSSIKVVSFTFSSGQELSEHTATKPALIHQVSGSCRWGLGEDMHDAKLGDWAFLPPHLKHSIFANEDAKVLLLLLT
jgi:quercetin dioxygenase-like cupin family protein